MSERYREVKKERTERRGEAAADEKAARLRAAHRAEDLRARGAREKKTERRGDPPRLDPYETGNKTGFREHLLRERRGETEKRARGEERRGEEEPRTFRFRERKRDASQNKEREPCPFQPGERCTGDHGARKKRRHGRNAAQRGNHPGELASPKRQKEEIEAVDKGCSRKRGERGGAERQYLEAERNEKDGERAQYPEPERVRDGPE